MYRIDLKWIKTKSENVNMQPVGFRALLRTAYYFRLFMLDEWKVRSYTIRRSLSCIDSVQGKSNRHEFSKQSSYSQNNRLKLKTSRGLPDILEECIEYTSNE
jgi:hypothetical protein